MKVILLLTYRIVLGELKVNYKPKISIITVSFNSSKTIVETIEHVLTQTYDNFEYIIIDGLSSDNTLDIAYSFVEKFAQKAIPYKIVSEEDNGIYDAMNKGIALAKGEIIGIINSDDYYNNDTLEKVVKFYNESNFDLMYADLRIFGEKKEYIKKSSLSKKFTTRLWNHPTTFVTRKVYQDFKYANESIYDDLNFMLTARRKEYKICVLNEVLANFRLGGVSNKKNWKNCRERIKLRNRIYKNNGCKGYKLDNFLTEFAKYILS